MNNHQQQFQLILKYFKHFDNIQINKLSQLHNIYLEWNKKINLISRKDFDNFYLHHVLHSLSILKFIAFKPNCTFADVGTGGGLPGIPLAIALPNCYFYLIDSIEKKIKVVQDIANQLQLNNVTFIRNRVEHVSLHVNYVLGRAVSMIPQFYQFTKHLISQEAEQPRGIIYFKGGNLEKEIEQFNNNVIIFRIYEKINEKYFETKKIIFIDFSNIYSKQTHLH